MLKLEAEAVTGQPVKIPFDFADLSSVPDGKTPGDSIVIKPMTVGTWFRLKPLLASVDKEDIQTIVSNGEPVFNQKTGDIMQKYDVLLFEIACVGIHNKNGDMPQWFRETLKKNCTWQDIFIIINAIFFRLNHISFMNSITLTRSVSPLGEEEIIALQENKKTWVRKVLPHSS